MSAAEIAVIEAGAGSGKTYRLADEIVRAIESGQTRPEAIVLTTFTRRAAAELTSRVGSRLIAGGLGAAALRVGQARIGTVHSVCGSLLEQFALTAGLAVRQNVIPDSEQQRLLNVALSTVLEPDENETIHRLARLLYRPDWREDVHQLISAARSNAITADQLGQYSQASIAQIEAALPAPQGNSEECLQLARTVGAELQALVDAGTDHYKSTQRALEVLRGYLAFAERGIDVYWHRYHQLASTAPAKRSGAHAIYQPLAELAERHLAWPEFRQQLGDYVRRTFAIAARTASRYEMLKRQSGVIDFADQEALAVQLLERPEVRTAIGNEVDLVLVDEFQDTSPLQLRLFLLLAECTPRSVWVGDPRQAIYGFRGTDPELMLAVLRNVSQAGASGDGGAGAAAVAADAPAPAARVGEPPRRAAVGETGTGTALARSGAPGEHDVAAGEAGDGGEGGTTTVAEQHPGARHRPPASGATERLDRSWRSLPALVSFVNEVFPAAFVSHGSDSSPVALHPVRQQRLPDGDGLESWVLAGNNQREDYLSVAAGVVECLRRRDQRPVFDPETGRLRALASRDVAILARTNAECAGIAAALAAKGVAVEMGTAGLLRQPVCMLVLAATTLLVEPADRLAAAQVAWFHEVWLHADGSPAADDAAAGAATAAERWLEARVAERQPPAPAGADKVAAPPADTADTSLNAVVRRLQAAGASARLLSPIELVQRAADLCDVWQLVAGAPAATGPARAAADIDQLLSLVREYEQLALQRGQGISHGGLLAWLRSLQESGGDARRAATSDAVRITTWHGAKGLEWPLVILYGFGDEPMTRFFGIRALTEGDLDLAQPLRHRALRFIPFPYHESTRNCAYRQRFAATEAYDAVLHTDAAERLRLLYVIATRARDRLVFAARRHRLRGLDVGSAPLFELPQDPAAAPAGWRVHAVDMTVAAPAVGAEPTGASDTNNAATDLSWFRYAAAAAPAAPARILPSQLVLPRALSPLVAPGTATRLGARIAVAPGADLEQVGTAVHRFLAVDTSRMDQAAVTALAGRLLATLPPDTLATQDVVSRQRELTAFITDSWPGAVVRREWPLSLRLDELQIDGQADLVVDDGEQLAVIDYKTFSGDADLTAHAQRYAPQLAAYALALERAAAQPCRRIMVCYALQGMLLELQIADRAQLVRATVAELTTATGAAEPQR